MLISNARLKFAFIRELVLNSTFSILNEREGDINLLIEKLLGQVNKEHSKDPAYEHKKLSGSAKKLLISIMSIMGVLMLAIMAGAFMASVANAANAKYSPCPE